MIVKTLNQEAADNTTYQIYNPVTRIDPVTNEEFTLNECVWSGRVVDLDSNLSSIDSQIASLQTQKALYESYKTEIESI